MTMIGTNLRTTYHGTVRDTFNPDPEPDGDLTAVVSAILGYDLRTIGSPDDAWFWSRRWQEMEAEADADFAAGHIASFDNGDDFLSELDSDD
jgi:hypothetical protein